MSFNSSSFSNSILKNSKNNNITTSRTTNTNPKNYLFSDISKIYSFCNNLSEINNKNENGYTPLYLSVLSNNIPVLKELIFFDADINVTNNLNETPLFLSVDINNYEALLYWKILIF